MVGINPRTFGHSLCMQYDIMSNIGMLVIRVFSMLQNFQSSNHQQLASLEDYIHLFSFCNATIRYSLKGVFLYKS